MATHGFLRRLAARYPRHLSAAKATLQNHAQQSVRMSSGGTSGLLKVTKDAELQGVSLVEMSRPPVNSLNLEMITEFNIALDKLESTPDSKGVIITSSVPGIFSAGLDIMEMYQPKEERLRLFWRSLQDLFMKLYGSPLVTMAAITGASPAGGCLVSLCCDYRVIAELPKAKVGLNEAQLGMMVPPWLKDSYVQTIGHREAERACQLGTLFTPTEALSVGLVDQVIPLEEVIEKCRKEMVVWLKIPEHARQLIKQDMRRPLLEKMLSRREEDIDSTVAYLMRDSIQKSMGAYLEALKQKGKK